MSERNPGALAEILLVDREALNVRFRPEADIRDLGYFGVLWIKTQQ